MTPYEKIVTEEAAKWFPECEDLLIWAWDGTVPGLCHPLSVVSAWEDRRGLPPQVRMADEGLLRQYLAEEWSRSGLDPATIPETEAYADANGRRVWRMNLSMAEENLLPLGVVTELALAFRENPDSLPRTPGVFWHVTEEFPQADKSS